MPRISPFSFPNNATVGQRGTAICTATEGDQPLTFRWLKNGRRLDGGEGAVTDNADFSVLKIQSLDVNSSGNYTCVVTNLVGSASQSAVLTVHAPPKWIQEPTSTAAKSGEKVRIPCRATGHPAPTIVWMRPELRMFIQPLDVKCCAGDDSSCADRSIYALFVISQMEHPGTLQLTISTFIFTFLFEITSAKPTVPPRITPFSFASRLVAGQRATITCAIYEGDQPLTFVWLKDGTVISKGSQNVETSEGAGYSTLTISPLSLQNSGNYTCVVSNAAGSDSTSSSLTVHAAPRWIQAPKDVVVSVGDSVSMSCAAEGHPTPTILWSKNGEQFIRVLHYASVSSHCRITTRPVASPIRDRPRSGPYSMQEIYALDRTAHIFLVLMCSTLFKEVQASPAPPKVLPFVIPRNLLVGERISITCSAASGSKPLAFTWVKDDTTLHRESALRITDSSDYSTLSIENLKITDAGNYTCVVSNPEGTVSHSDVLHVKAAPTWTREPKDTTVTAGDVVTLECNGTGFPPPKISWQKEGASSTDSSGTGVIRIASASKKHEGNYKCHISNGIGADLQKTVRVTVKCTQSPSTLFVHHMSTKISPFIFSKNLLVGERTSVICATTSGDQPLTFAWLKDGKPLRQSAKINLANNPQFSALTIQKLELGDAGNYTCSVSNTQGTVSYTDTLEVRVPPSIPPFQFPKNLEVQQRISVICTISIGEKPLQFSWLKDGSALHSGSQNVRIVDNAESSTLHIDVLTLNSAGNYTCSVTNKAGHSSFTAPLVVHAPKIQPFTFPSTLNVGERSGTLCIVTAGDKPLTFSWFKDGSALVTSDNVKVTNSAELSMLNFGSLDASHNGNYTCSLRLLGPQLPTDKVLISGENGSFVCKALGFPAPTIRWFKAGRAGSSDEPVQHENGTIHIVTARKEHEGTYNCVADNGIGTSISKAVHLEVKCRRFSFLLFIVASSANSAAGEKPQLQPLMFPRNRIRVGESASALCALVAGSPEVRFRWFKDSVEISATVTNVKVKNDKKVSVLTVEPATLESAGNYTCMAANNYGTDANSATLVVEATPQWRTEPKDVSVSAGHSLRVECSASGFPIPNLSWRKTEPAKDGIKTQVVLGSGSATLTVPQASKQTEGRYVCQAENGIGTALRKSVFIKVKHAPRIQPFSFNNKVRTGGRAIATCTVITEAAPVTFTWTKDGARLQQADGRSIQETNLVSVLIIQRLEASSRGNYTCRASNVIGADEHTAELLVEAPPAWTSEPQDLSAITGSNVTAQCSASGSPSPRITWTRTKGVRVHRQIYFKNVCMDVCEAVNTALLTDGTSTVVQTEAGLLFLPTIRNSEAGTYSCAADNGVAPAIRKAIRITIRGMVPPRIRNVITVTPWK
ncbi:hypothetical protein HPB48_021080 [Haemaphysalis longicornis]|uniref:Ig-like domain-containing protein n=1 Tax=Haemaphysalis longicornis TaxID=44386 RepID=A0A9J6GR02_HAELO|nr:hypothetical protein HPB48_021080 [Haemaphysalis longicornis]